MKSNYDRSKTIIRKTTKNYHPRADADDRKREWKPQTSCVLKICLTQPIGL